ncbi:MAG TPA: group 1 truncated hemoglobin [Acidobacteriota bacterium]|nr:group 1 truncated hemoglobin [Acidobacteriota bacterium]
MAEHKSLFERLGGEKKLRALIDTFIDRVFDDRMIGFFFRNADRGRIKEMEYQLAAEFLGAGIKYTGRPLGKVHSNHPIMGGHFARRRQILKETLESFVVPDEIKTLWLEHTDALRPLITPESGSGCDPIAARQRAGIR